MAGELVGVRVWGVVLGLALGASAGFGQSAPAGRGEGGEVAAGVGASAFNVDWGHSRMEGVTAWADWRPGWVPAGLRGLGFEAEYRDISLGRGSGVPSNFRLDTTGGGVMYRWPRLARVRPYGKWLWNYGAIDWNNPSPQWRHETRTVESAGGGVEWRMLRAIWVRADYEYEFWPDIASFRPNSSHVLDPQGITVGMCYGFGEGWKRRW